MLLRFPKLKKFAFLTCLCYAFYGTALPAWADAILDAASQGQQTGMEVLGGAVSNMPGVSTQNPTVNNHSSASTIYLPEVLPGTDPDQLSQVESFGSSMLANPRSIHTNAMKRWFDLHRVGCRTTSIAYLDEHTTLRAYRILRNNKTGETQNYTQPWTLNLGKYPTLGVAKTVTWDQRYDDNRTLVTIVELSPFPQPRDGTYFTYDHQILSGTGTITSYGTLENGFATQGVVNGTGSIAIQAKLYRIDRTWLRNPDDNSPPPSCPPDPPDPCQMAGVNWCDPKASGIAPLISSGSPTFGDSGAYGSVHTATILQYESQPPMDLTGDLSIMQGVSQTNAAMTGTDPMTSALFGGCTVADTTANKTVTVHNAEIHTCSGIFTSADSCTWNRRFNFSKTSTRDILTVTQYCKSGTPPTYQPCPISVMPDMVCPGSGAPLDTCTFGYPSTWTKTIDNNTYQQYSYTPFLPSNNQFTWHDATTCSIGAEKCSHASSLYTITDNRIEGCSLYTMMLWDGWCSGAVTCTDYRSCVTIDDVTFCDGDPGSQKIIEKIETMPYPAGHPTHPGELIYAPMCWAGGTEPMQCQYWIGTDECYTDPQGQVHCPETTGGGFAQHPELCPGPPELCGYFKDDCESAGLYGNSACKYVGIECAEGAQGTYSGICYAPDIQYDCGEDHTFEAPGGPATAQICASELRCLGSECHNVRGESNADFGYALSALTGVELMQNDLVCSETGQPPTEQQIQNNTCTIRIFQGKKMKCKRPVGIWSNVGVPNCCSEGLKAASGVNAADYLVLAFAVVNLAKNPVVLKGLSSVPGTSPVFELFENVGSLYSSATQALKTALTSPFASAVEHLGFKVTSSTAEQAAKSAVQDGILGGVKQNLMQAAYNVINDVFGPELANNLFTVSGGQVMLNATIATALNVVSVAFTLYNLLKILMSIIFACHEDELKLGIERKLGKCTYVGSYCTGGFLCPVKKESYCCYNTPLARIIMEQVRRQLGGFGSKRNPNCNGLSPSEMQSVNWDAIDLTEWTQRLTDSGIIPQSPQQADQRWGASNVEHLQREYGISEIPGQDGNFTKADSNLERFEPHAATMVQGREELKDEPFGYVEPEEAPQYRPGSPPPPNTPGYIDPP